MASAAIPGASQQSTRPHAELRPVLAGRNADRVGRIAKALNLPYRSFSLNDPAEVRQGLAGIAAVLHAAGPFSATSRPMAEGCIEAGAHYCDITGEIDVFESLAGFDARARAAGVMLLPGCGFDVVPSDCLAAHLVARLPGAVKLRLSIGGLTRFSQGTAKTMVEGVARGAAVRVDGRIVERPRPPRSSADFGHGPKPTIGVSWGDVSTAWRSTGIPDIGVFFEADRAMRAVADMPPAIKRVFSLKFVQRMLTTLIDRRLPPGPTARGRELTGSAIIVAEAGPQQVSGRQAIRDSRALCVHGVDGGRIVRRAASGEAVAASRRLRRFLAPTSCWLSKVSIARICDGRTSSFILVLCKGQVRREVDKKKRLQRRGGSAP